MGTLAFDGFSFSNNLFTFRIGLGWSSGGELLLEGRGIAQPETQRNRWSEEAVFGLFFVSELVPSEPSPHALKVAAPKGRNTSLRESGACPFHVEPGQVPNEDRKL